MSELRVGDMIAGGRAILGENGGGYVVMNAMTGNVVKCTTINNYQEHDVLLGHADRVFCPECGAEQHTDEDEYPYVRMLHALSNECEATERFK